MVATSPTAATTRPDPFLAGDGLRALAATGVLVYHGLVLASLTGVRESAAATGGFATRAGEVSRLGLWVFFVLSGYLLSRPFLHAFLDRRPVPPIGRYIRNRALRIVPAFWMTATLTIIVFGTLGSTKKQVLAIYLFAQELDPSRLTDHIRHAWSIDVEVIFYLLLPVVAVVLTPLGRRLAQRWRITAVWTLLASIFVASIAFQASKAGALLGPGAQRSFPATVFGFVPGVALAALEPYALPRLRSRGRHRPIVWVLLTLAVGGAAAHAALLSNTAALSTCAALASGGLVGAALVHQWGTGRGWRAFDNRTMRWLGVRSYGIYLLHLGVMIFVAERLGDLRLTARYAILIGAGFAVATLGAAISWRFVEAPLLRLRQGWQRAA